MHVRSSDALWKEGGGYYAESAEDLRTRPLLPDPRRLRDRRFHRIFTVHAELRPGSHVLELGCGRSRWLPYLAKAMGCSVAGIDIEPAAADLARANLAGAGTKGEVRCGDAFSLQDNHDLLGKFDLVYSMGLIEHFEDAAARLTVLGNFLKPGGRILTTVPNLQGVNWVLQRLGGIDRLEMHVIYDSQKLAQAHEKAGFETLAAGYAGFYEGFLTAAGSVSGKVQRDIHRWLCRWSNMFFEAWGRALPEFACPEISWLSPHVFYVGRRPFPAIQGTN